MRVKILNRPAVPALASNAGRSYQEKTSNAGIRSCSELSQIQRRVGDAKACALRSRSRYAGMEPESKIVSVRKEDAQCR